MVLAKYHADTFKYTSSMADKKQLRNNRSVIISQSALMKQMNRAVSSSYDIAFLDHSLKSRTGFIETKNSYNNILESNIDDSGKVMKYKFETSNKKLNK